MAARRVAYYVYRAQIGGKRCANTLRQRTALGNLVPIPVHVAHTANRQRAQATGGTVFRSKNLLCVFISPEDGRMCFHARKVQPRKTPSVPLGSSRPSARQPFRGRLAQLVPRALLRAARKKLFPAVPSPRVPDAVAQGSIPHGHGAHPYEHVISRRAGAPPFNAPPPRRHPPS